MLFNSSAFAVFLLVVYLLYWSVGSKHFRLQNVLIVIASYVFYGWWDWRFLGLLILSTLLDFTYGFWVASPDRRKARLFLWLSIINNFGILALFKYYNFFASEFATFMASFGWEVHPFLLTWGLPVGISFYTFHGMSYVFDIYNGRQKPIANFIHYAAFVCYFPLLVAGPIERANHLLPQFLKPRTFDMETAKDGLRQMLWGFFKKLVMADGCAIVVDRIFQHSDYSELGTMNLLFAGIFFTFQIYGDFSGYSDIAMGCSKLFGIQILRNFNYPFFSRNIAEFWRRWHISLSSWFRDYLYIPLGGSQKGKWVAVRNTMLVFFVSGFWHGANWTFINWGILHGLLFVPLIFTGANRKFTDVADQGKILPSIGNAGRMLLTFTLVMLLFILFRAENMSQAIDFLSVMFTTPTTNPGAMFLWITSTPMIFALVVLGFEWAAREKVHGLEIAGLSAFRRRAIYIALVACILFFKQLEPQEFIYFQF
jgi:D-alanyl-lipoteichoic acid acyltransferase DltB (MBOAT superfamily)